MELEYINEYITDTVKTNLVHEAKESKLKEITHFLRGQNVIYEIYNNSNRKYYIGSTGDGDPISRLKRHWLELKTNKHCNIHLQRAFNKYGEEAFSFVILECFRKTGNREEDLKKREKREQEYIDKMQACDMRFGYNIAQHVHGGFNDSTWETLTIRSNETPEQILLCLDLLENTVIPFPEIDKIVRVDNNLSYRIYHRKNFKRLAKDRVFKERPPYEEPKGEKGKNAKISDEQAISIIRRLQSPELESYSSIAKDFGISKAAVRDIYLKRNWKHLTRDITFPERKGYKTKS